MKVINSKQPAIFTLIIILLFIFTSPASGTDTRPGHILVLPFDIYSETDLTFLQNGIFEMLVTRLGQTQKVEVIALHEVRRIVEKNARPISERTALSLAATAEAEFVLFGSLTVFGDSISTDAHFFNVAQEKALVTFNRAGESKGDVIDHISRFAAQINAVAFGLQGEGSSTSDDQAADDTRNHPESLWQAEGQDQPEAAPALIPAAIQATADKPVALWKSRSLKMGIGAMALGDVDGDGRNETVVIGDQDILVYRYISGKFQKIQSIEGGGFDHFIAVDIADINRNGRAEVFVTNLLKNDIGLSSFVLEWDGTRLVKIVKKTDWFLRTLAVAGGPSRLLGQKRGKHELFGGRVQSLEWKNGNYVTVGPYPLPTKLNIYGFAQGDLGNSGRTLFVAFTPKEHLQVIDPNGDELWRSGERYGGGNTILEAPDAEKKDIAFQADMYYKLQRVLIADVDADGRNEVLVTDNKEATGRILSRQRFFKNGQLAILSWDGISLVPRASSRSFQKYISDLALTDFDGNGSPELVYAVVAKSGSLLTKPKSYIVSQKLD